MSVVIHTRDSLWSQIAAPCPFCGEDISVPFIEWCSAPDIDNGGEQEDVTLVMCARCAPRVLRGLGRDLRQLITETPRAMARASFSRYCCEPVPDDERRQ
jgi:hypothetical protein